MKKITIILVDKLDKHAEFTSGAYYLQDYFKIEFIICKSWAWNIQNKKLDENYFSKTKTLFNYFIAENFNNLKTILKKRKPDFIFDLTNEILNNEINQLSNNIKSKHVIIKNGHFSAPFSIRLFLKIKNFFNRKNLNLVNLPAKKTKPKNFILKIIKNFFSKKLKADIALIAGLDARSTIKNKSKTEIFDIGSNDYYTFKKNNQINKKKNRGKYILFIDTLLIENPEDEFQGNVSINKEDFKKLHKKLFDHIEKVTNLPILVAGHRRGKKLEGYKQLFHRKEVIFDKTLQLIKNCEAVISSFSTAISLAVLSYKPIIFYTSPFFDSCPWGPFIYTQSQILGRKIINFEEGKTLERDYKIVDKKRYNKFINRYIYYKNNNKTEKIPFESFINKYK